MTELPTRPKARLGAFVLLFHLGLSVLWLQAGQCKVDRPVQLTLAGVFKDSQVVAREQGAQGGQPASVETLRGGFPTNWLRSGRWWAGSPGVRDDTPAFRAGLQRLSRGGQLLVPPGLYR